METTAEPSLPPSQKPVDTVESTVQTAAAATAANGKADEETPSKEDDAKDDATASTWGRRKVMLAVGVALVIIIVLVLVLVLVVFRKDQRAKLVTEFINNNTLSGQVLTAATSKSAVATASLEQRALTWLIKHDTLSLVPNTPVNRFRLQQRYAIGTLIVQEMERYLRESTTGHFDVSYGEECEGFGWVNAECQNASIGSDLVNVSVVSDIELLATYKLSPDLGLLSHLQTYEGFLDGCLTESALVTASILEHWTDLKNFTLHGTVEKRPKAAANINQTTALPEALGRWTSLEYIDASFGVLCGTLPSWIGVWTNLKSLDFQANELYGTLPESTRNWTQLEQITLLENRLTTTLPATMANWSNLQNAYFEDTWMNIADIPPSVCESVNITEEYYGCGFEKCPCEKLCFYTRSEHNTCGDTW